MPYMRYLLYIGIISIISLTIASCSGGSGGGGQGISDTNKTTVIINLGKRDVNTTVVSAQQIPLSVCYIVFYISAPDMSPIEQTVNVEGGGSISTAFAVPNGVNRHFEVFAYDCGDTLLYYGDTYADLDGTSVTISINMVSTADETPPAFGGLISASAISTTEIDLNWTPATDDVTPSLNIIYLIYMSTSPGGQNFAAPSFTTPAGAVSRTVTGLSPSTTYYTVVRAKDEAGNIDGNTVERSATTQTPPDTTSPAFGGLISASAISTTEIDLNWTPATDDVTPSSGIVYYIYQAITPGGEDLFNPTYVTAPGAVSYAVNGLVPDTTYYFIARARDGAGNIDDNTEERSAVTFPSTLQYTLIVISAGTGTGTVTSNPAGINCGGDCSEPYDDGTVVTLTATADAGSYFAGWSGNADCSDAIVTMDTNKSCTATFDNLIGLYVDINTGADTAGCGSPASPCRTITFTLTQTTGNEPIYVAAGTYDTTAGETFPFQLLSDTSLICQGAGYSTVIDSSGFVTAILGASGASIEVCRILGAVSDNGTATTIDNCMIDLSGSSFTGIALSGDSTVTNSTITGVDDDVAILVSGGSPNITNNTITNNPFSTGVVISGGNPTISGNTITYNDYGVDIFGGSATITGNTISNNDNIGVYIYVTSPTLTGNTITYNDEGVNISGGSPTITGNTITDNYSGVYMSSGTPAINNNILSCNTAVDLWNWTTGPPVDAQSNQWDNVPPTEIDYPDPCTLTGEDICNANSGSVDTTGASLAPSPCASAGDSWTPTSLTGAPLGRYWPTAVWTGTEMIVWGGLEIVGPINTGGRYNPSTDTWTATSTTGAPSARYDHTAVWTGTEMIVWGGSDGYMSYLNTGGRYNPSTDTWTATSTTGAPSARYDHTAVWTGTEMIVWGGIGSVYSVLNTGGRYDPSTDTWTATSLTGAPAARSWHTAVWTGTEMIVWGGSSFSGGINTGGRYDPSTDTWTATSLTGAPLGRTGHTAVWTGTEMVVWGSNYLGNNQGGRYNPSTNSWTATTTAGAPAGRGNHTAVWTGTEMIVWGGGSNLNTGGRYNPSTDIWTATSTTNAPSGRQLHTAVWTGTEMIVWGGWDGISFFNTGGRYTP